MEIGQMSPEKRSGYIASLYNLRIQIITSFLYLIAENSDATGNSLDTMNDLKSVRARHWDPVAVGRPGSGPITSVHCDHEYTRTNPFFRPPAPPWISSGETGESGPM